MGKRTNTAKWMDNQSRWQINVQRNGTRRSFTSSKPGRNGQREANAKADAWLDEGIVAGKKVDELWEMYLGSVKESSGTSNYISVASIGRTYIMPVIGQMRIESVNEGHLQSIIDKAYKNGSNHISLRYNKNTLPENEKLSRKTLNNIMQVTKRFMKFCRVRVKCTTLNPEALTIPAAARYKGKSILQPESLAILFSKCGTTYYRKPVFDEHIYAYRFIVATGVRPGEAIGLKCGDIVNDTVRIKRSINVLGEVTCGKNENAIRSFVLTEIAKKAYLEQLEYLKSRKIAITPETSLFQVEKEINLYHAWQKYCTVNGIPKISLYELRHTFVSISKQLPEGRIKNVVGHSKNMDTFGVYGHQLRGEMEEVAEDINKLFVDVLKNKSVL